MWEQTKDNRQFELKLPLGMSLFVLFDEKGFRADLCRFKWPRYEIIYSESWLTWDSFAEGQEVAVRWARGVLTEVLNGF